MQGFLLFFNPLISGLIFLEICLTYIRQKGWYIDHHELILYANVVFYRFNNDFITISTPMQTSNFGSISGSIDLIKMHDLLYSLDLIVTIVLFVMLHTNLATVRMDFRKPLLVLTTSDL